ncbi:hypothetical protein ND748_31125, partial [Frankia sp. AiPs1]|nr:hypothetical protein [Frankia sp. AiPs1]
MATVDRLSIEMLWTEIRNLSDETIAGISHQWSVLSQAHYAAATTLETKAADLTLGWQGQGADAYLRHLGDTVTSLRDAGAAAGTNAAGLAQLANQVGPVQKAMDALWREYKAKYDHAVDSLQNANAAQKLWWDTLGEPPHPEKIADEYTLRARDLVRPLEQTASAVTPTIVGPPAFNGPKGINPAVAMPMPLGGAGRPGGAGSPEGAGRSNHPPAPGGGMAPLGRGTAVASPRGGSPPPPGHPPAPRSGLPGPRSPVPAPGAVPAPPGVV